MFHQFDEDELLDTFDTRSELRKTVQQSCTNTPTEMRTLPKKLRESQVKAQGKLRQGCQKLHHSPQRTRQKTVVQLKLPENFHKARQLHTSPKARKRQQTLQTPTELNLTQLHCQPK